MAEHNNSFCYLQDPHLACVLLLDISKSMEGESIDNLNEAINKFKIDIMMDDLAQFRIDIAIVTFSSSVQVVQDFVSISGMKPVSLSADGSTKMADGIDTAIDLVKERIRFYHRMGTPCFKPWIFMITDGYPDPDQNMEAAAERIQIEESKGKLKFWACGVGEYDKKTMFTLTKEVIELKNFEFKSIFDWPNGSISEVRMEERPINLPQTARKADPDCSIGEDWD